MKECDKIRNLFGAYLHDGVTPDERAAIEGHIQGCEECAADLRSRQKVLEKLELYARTAKIAQRTQDDFAWNVYRKIASDALRSRSRQVFFRRFVLQPSLAVTVLAVVIAVGVLRFHVSPAEKLDRVSPVATADEASQRERRATLFVEEFFRQQGVSFERESRYASADETSATTVRPSLDANHFMQNSLLPDSQRRLEEANFINYSLGDRRRALAEYQRVVDYYPGTDAAMEAQRRIEAISSWRQPISGRRVRGSGGIQGASAPRSTEL